MNTYIDVPGRLNYENEIKNAKILEEIKTQYPNQSFKSTTKKRMSRKDLSNNKRFICNNISRNKMKTTDKTEFPKLSNRKKIFKGGRFKKRSRRKRSKNRRK